MRSAKAGGKTCATCGMVQLQPGDPSCAERMSLYIHAGKEILERHSACQQGRIKTAHYMEEKAN
jgi:hypothetical protein